VNAAISLNNLTKMYGKDRGIEGITFDVAPGQVFGFLGPNGSGKSTAMRTLLGLISATSGSASILGQNSLRHNPKIMANVGYLPGVFSPYKNLKAADYLHYISRLRKIDCTKRIVELADQLDLNLNKHIHDLSKGNRQKVGVIQAFMHKPAVLILDEPTSGLDPVIQREFEAILQEAKNSQSAVLLSSHVLSEVEHLADQIAVISNGKLLLNEKIKDLKARARHTINFTFGSPIDQNKYSSLAKVISYKNNVLTCEVNTSEKELLKQAVLDGAISVETHEPALDKIFLDLIDYEEN
jgi:ABC-2 type transport system ATP-binding protein